MRHVDSVSRIVIPAVCMAIGAAVSVAVFGSSSEEHALISKRLTEFCELDEHEQKTVKASFAEFSVQSEDRKQEILALHAAVLHDPGLKAGLDSYFEWWSSLSQSEWDTFPEMSRDQQIAFVKARINNPGQREKEIVVDFADWGRTSLPPLHLTIDECQQIISDSLEDAPVPPVVAEEMQQLTLSEHRALTLSLWLFDRFRSNSDRKEMEVQGEMILQAVLTNVSDELWKQQFQLTIAKNSGRSFIRFWTFRNLLVIFDQSTMTLGSRLMKQFPVSDAEIVTAFVSLNDKVLQHSLMTSPGNEARMRLEFLVQSNRTQTPEQKLLVKFISFARDRQRIIGDITFGPGSHLPRSSSPVPRTRNPE